MKFHAFALTALLCSATQTAEAFGFEPYQTYAVGSRADSVAVGDVDGDGRDDVIVATTFRFDTENDHKLFVFFQRTDGTLMAPQKIAYNDGVYADWSRLVVADLNRDGAQDIIVSHNGGITVFQGNSARPLTPVKIASRVVTVLDTADVDGDGHLDIVGHNYETAIIYYGDGKGGIRKQTEFPAPIPGSSSGLHIGDINADGFDDLTIASNQGDMFFYIFMHDGISGFVSTPVIVQTNFYSIGGLAGGDFNQDGFQDIAIGNRANSPTQVSVYYQANGVLSAPVDYEALDGPGVMLGEDIDGDGLDDLVVANELSGAISLYRQGATGLQTRISTVTPTPFHNPTGMAVGDINNDGCKDVAIANYEYGLVWLYGNGCQVLPDLGVAVGLTPTTAAIRLEHVSGTAALQQPLVQIDLSVRSGALQTGTLPAGCVLQSQSMRMSRVECLVDTMTPGTVTTLIVPLSAASPNFNLLTASARASTDTTEHSLSNNQTSKTILLGSAKLQPALKRPVAKATQR